MTNDVGYYNRLVFTLILQNDLAKLRSVLNIRPDALESIDQYSNTPLLYASYRGRSQLTRYLLAIGANPKRINVFGKYSSPKIITIRLINIITTIQLFSYVLLPCHQGQSALTLATYSGDLDTCKSILNAVDFDELNAIGILSPLCVAALQGNTDIAQIYLTLETSKQFECPSETIHGICPLQLAQNNDDYNMIELLRPKHQTHLLTIPSVHLNSIS